MPSSDHVENGGDGPTPVPRLDHGFAARAILADCPFALLLGIEFAASHADGLVLRMPVREQALRASAPSVVHGGAVATLIDVTGGIAASIGLDRPAYTTDLRIDYLTPARGDHLTGTAVVRRRGMTTVVVDVEVHNDGRSLSAIGRAVFAVRRNAKARPEPRLRKGG